MTADDDSPDPDGFPRRPLVSVERQVETNLETGRSQTRMFVKMYFEARDSGLLATMPPELWITLCCLATYMNESGLCYPGQARMARELGISRQQLNARLKKLEAFRFQGRPVVQVSKERRGSGGRWARNVYRVLPISGLGIFGDRTAGGPEQSQAVSSEPDTVPVSARTDSGPPDVNESQGENENTRDACQNLRRTAPALVSRFHEGMGRPAARPKPKEVRQAIALIERYGLEEARFIVDHALDEARRTRFGMRHFGAVLSYAQDALVSFSNREAQRSRARAQERRHREDALHAAYQHWKRAELQSLKANIAAHETAQIEDAARSRVLAAYGGIEPLGFDMLVRIAVDDTLASRYRFPDFESWRRSKPKVAAVANTPMSPEEAPRASGAPPTSTATTA